MPHQCVRCGKFYPDGSEELLKGCNCGGRFFFYVKKPDIEKAKEIAEELTQEDKKQIEQDVMEIVGDEVEDDQPVIFDFESIKVLKPGKYSINLIDIFKGKPLVYQLEDGKYVIDLAGTFKLEKEEKEG